MGYDACFFCAGISSVGISEEDYRRITYDTTLQFAKALHPNTAMTFVYVSGGGTDSSEKGRMHWARVKGKTENDLAKLPFKQAFGFRIGMVKPAIGQQYVHKYYKYAGWLFPFFRFAIPSIVNTMSEVTHAMLYLSMHGYDKNVIHVNDIRQLSKKFLQ
jgi:hypothetical protein